MIVTYADYFFNIAIGFLFGFAVTAVSRVTSALAPRRDDFLTAVVRLCLRLRAWRLAPGPAGRLPDDPPGQTPRPGRRLVRGHEELLTREHPSPYELLLLKTFAKLFSLLHYNDETFTVRFRRTFFGIF